MRILLTVLIFTPLITYCQPEEAKEIYTAALVHYYRVGPASIVVTDSTVNRFLGKTDYAKLIYRHKNGKWYVYFQEIDSTWLVALKQADSLKGRIQDYLIQFENQPNLNVCLIPADSLGKSMKDMGHDGFMKVFGVGDRVELSSIIRINEKAILELGRTCGMLCGEGVLYFLEKRNGVWKVVVRLKLWVS